MLKISNLKIQYGDNNVIDCGQLDLKPGDFCLISGNSGAGKTSLIDVLSIQIKGNHHFEYYWCNENVNDFGEKRKSEFLLNDVAVVTQNNLIFADFTIKENLELFSSIGYEKVDDGLINELINKLQLSKLLNKKAKKLSGGEKQRVAIACAILKNANLYLFDEPTSMLDEDNKKSVVKLIENLAKKGKMVVVVSHEPEYISYTKEYCIENRKLLLKNKSGQDNSNLNQHASNIKRKGKGKFLKNLGLKFSLSNPILSMIYILLLSICFSGVFNVVLYSNKNMSVQVDGINTVSSAEVFVINSQGFGATTYDDQIFYAINDNVRSEIENVEHVNKVYPYIYFPLHNLSLHENNTDVTVTNYMNESNIILMKNNVEIDSFNYYEKYNSAYAIYPTYSHQYLDEQCCFLDDSIDGIYISKKVADEFGIDSIENLQINLNFSVPIASDVGTMYSAEDAENISLIRFMFPVMVNRTFNVRGILEKDVGYYSYELNYDPAFFLPIDMIENIQLAYWEKNKDLINDLTVTPMENIELSYYYPTRLIDNTMWKSSALILEIDNRDNIQSVINDISLIDPGLSIVITNFGIPISNGNIEQNVKGTTYIYITIMYVTILLAVSIVQAFIRKRRQKDWELLQINGITKQEIQSVEKYELLINTMLIFILSIINFQIELNVLQILTSLTYKIQIQDLFILLITIILTMYIGNSMSYLIKPIKME